MKVQYLTTLVTVSLLSLGFAVGCTNPCAAKEKTPGATTETQENPCASKTNPCASKEKNPCASKTNPCASKEENPCASKANPCASKEE
ncbi:MAG: hypothetical protein SW833_15665 [Cyanobacteriota bacterium]|nr:hypothetical protein [Cyanobacteriota bacterium]